MKKLILSIVALVATATSVSAQSEWKMVITHADGTTTEIKTSDVKDIQYVQQMPHEADANVDQIVIMELYNGGCPKDEGSAAFSNDKCIVLYNNCSQKAVVNNLCIAFASPYKGHANNKNYTEDGKLSYEAEGFTPAFGGLWWYPYSLIIEPYSQVVINVSGAIDNTQTYSQSVNYAHAEYYCMYDPESGFANTSWYPTPASVIPTSHYLKAKRLGVANSWPLSNTSPAVFVFQTKDVDPAVFAENADNLWYDGGEAKDINACLKVTNDWIIDGLTIVLNGYGSSTSCIDVLACLDDTSVILCCKDCFMSGLYVNAFVHLLLAMIHRVTAKTKRGCNEHELTSLQWKTVFSAF